jgi:cyclopropane fatty-acyl-phospholipid synthase-like methyltransferase
MAEHVGLRRFQSFLTEIRELLEDDGLFYMQVAGLRATWQYEDFIWYDIHFFKGITSTKSYLL